MEVNAVHNHKTWDFCRDTKARSNILFGSAGSGKSWSIAQYLLLDKMFKENNIRVVVTRKTGPSLKKSAWLLVMDLIQQYNLMPYCKVNKTDMVIRIGTNGMFFVALDDPEKLKSFEKVNYVWAEEATELSKNDIMQLNIRCRGRKNTDEGLDQLFFSFNPVDEMSFWKPITENPPENVAVCHSTYKDNQFLSPEYIAVLENLIHQDVVYHKIYALGQWATPLSIIYSNWEIIEKLPEQYDDLGYGLDFGYSSSEAALIEVRFRGDELYEQELIYATGLTNPDLIARMAALGVSKTAYICADSAEPKSIQDIQRAGYNIHPANKGKDSVNHGISTIQAHKVFMLADSVNLIKERRSYKWKEDKDGNVLAEPVKFHDHLMDAERYIVQEMKGKTPVSLRFHDVGPEADPDFEDERMWESW